MSNSNTIRELFKPLSIKISDRLHYHNIGINPLEDTGEFLKIIDEQVTDVLAEFETYLVEHAPKLRKLAKDNKLKGAEELAEVAKNIADWILY